MFKLFLIVIAALTLAGCTTLGYYAQAASGELSILAHRRDVSRVIADPATPDGVRRKLRRASRIRHFASATLHLPDNDSYTSYVKLDRRYPVWVIYAAKPFSLAPLEWCYPFVGCVPYRGYFAKSDAKAFADRLRADGKDVYLGGAPAYSTLGWFADPLLSNMLRWPPAALAGVIFHELAHQVVYVDGDAKFNESFANTVEKVGVRRWLELHDKPAKLQALRHRHEATRAFRKRVIKLRRRLTRIYAASSDKADKRRQKAEAFDWLKRRHKKLEARYGVAIQANWFKHPLNNASLAVVTTYNVWQPAFQHLLHCDAGLLQRFYYDVKTIAALHPEARHQKLRQLMNTKQCPPP